MALGFCTQGKAGVQKSCRRRENERLSMVLYEDPFGGALTTSLRDSWEMEKNNPSFSRLDAIKNPAIC